jgi:hypothetical protein
MTNLSARKINVLVEMLYQFGLLLFVQKRFLAGIIHLNETVLPGFFVQEKIRTDRLFVEEKSLVR